MRQGVFYLPFHPHRHAANFWWVVRGLLGNLRVLGPFTRKGPGTVTSLSIIAFTILSFQCNQAFGAWQRFNTSDGLVSNNVYAIAQDRFANLWFGTDAGASRFDGLSWTNFHTANTDSLLAGDSILSIVQDRTGLLWFGTDGGLSSYD